jgi:hypothetical protein
VTIVATFRHTFVRQGLAFVLTTSLIALWPTDVRAYNDYDNPACRWASSTTQVYYTYGPNLIGDPNYLWRLRFEDSVANWNAVAGRPDLIFISGVSNNLDSYWAADGLYGYMLPHCSAPGPGNMIYFDVRVNGQTMAQDFAWNDNAMRSVTGHELGHGLGLGHTSVTLLALMHPGRDHLTIYSPQNDDRFGLWSLYP